MKRIIIGILSGALLAGTAAMSFGTITQGNQDQSAQREPAEAHRQRREERPADSARDRAHREQRVQINKEVRQDRKANGGNLTNKEKAQVNRQQNKVSKEIYNQKHDGQTQ